MKTTFLFLNLILASSAFFSNKALGQNEDVNVHTKFLCYSGKTKYSVQLLTNSNLNLFNTSSQKTTVFYSVGFDKNLEIYNYNTRADAKSSRIFSFALPAEAFQAHDSFAAQIFVKEHISSNQKAKLWADLVCYSNALTQ
jgi:hypothetical protein